jgi:hypothetical protein
MKTKNLLEDLRLLLMISKDTEVDLKNGCMVFFRKGKKEWNNWFQKDGVENEDDETIEYIKSFIKNWSPVFITLKLSLISLYYGTKKEKDDITINFNNFKINLWLKNDRVTYEIDNKNNISNTYIFIEVRRYMEKNFTHAM